MAANATSVIGDFPVTPGTMSGGPAFEVAVYIIVSMIVIVGIALLIAKAINNRKLEDWAKSEFMQVFVSAALVGGIYLLLAPGTGILTIAFNSLVPAEGFTIPGPVGGTLPVSGCPDATTAICYADNYLGYLSMQIMNIVGLIFGINIVLDILSKVAIDVIVVEVTPLSGLSSVVQVFNSALQSLMFLGILVGVERALLAFIDKVALQVFLPIGVVLRTFFGTRRLGGVMIAIAIGAYLVFPLTICLNGIMVKDATDSAYASLLAPLSQLNSQVTSMNPINSGEMSQPGAMLSPDKWTAPLENIKNSSSALMATINKIPQLLMTCLAILVVQIVFLPILSLIISGIAIKELAALFGSEINLSRFGV